MIVTARTGEKVLVDESDWGKVTQMGIATLFIAGPKQRIGFSCGSRIVTLARFIMGAKPNQIIDHINGNPLDNRRCNLRFVTTQQNAYNQKKQKRITSSRYKGVYRQSQSRKKSWMAYITQDGKKRNLGTYSTEEDAARAYDKAAKKLFGEYAHLNSPSQ